MGVTKGSVSESNRGNGWATGGLINNPAAGAALADTGPLPGGEYDFFILVYQELDAQNQSATLEHRNAANAATLRSQHLGPIVIMQGHCQNLHFFFWKGFTMAEDERLRIMQNAVVGTGKVQMSIMWARRR